MTSPADLAVRRGEIADAEAIGRLLHDFNSEFRAPTPGPRRLAERVRELLSEGRLTVLLAGTGPDGLVVLRYRADIWTQGLECNVAELYVVPDRRRRGLGHALMEAAIEVARREGAVHVEVATGEDDQGARALYERLGFSNRGGEPEGPMTLYYGQEL